MNKALVGILVGGIVVLNGAVGLGGVPLNNLEGVGGIAFNPLAYPAGNGVPEAKDEEAATKKRILGLPQIGAWYVHLGDSVDRLDGPRCRRDTLAAGGGLLWPRDHRPGRGRQDL